MSQLYLGIDPGKRTGLVVLSDETGSLGVVARTTREVYELGYQWLQGFYRQHSGAVAIVLETPPAAAPGSEQTYPLYIRWLEAMRVWAEANPKVTLLTIGPGEWKPFSKAQRWKKPKGWTVHEADALRMVRFAIVTGKVADEDGPPDLTKAMGVDVTGLAAKLAQEIRNANKKGSE